MFEFYRRTQDGTELIGTLDPFTGSLTGDTDVLEKLLDGISKTDLSAIDRRFSSGSYIFTMRIPKRNVIRMKGGPGSGHWGHQGRPGKVGGSIQGSLTSNRPINRRYFEVGPGKKLIATLYKIPPDQIRAPYGKVSQSDVIRALTADGHVLNSHLRGLAGIVDTPPEDRPNWEMGHGKQEQGFGKYAAGFYNPATRMIHIKTYTDATLIHELGHHVDYHSLRGGKVAWSGTIGYDVSFEGYTKFKKHMSGYQVLMSNYGLRSYSFSNRSEFMADLYTVHTKGHDFQKARVNGLFKTYKLRHPETGNWVTLKDVFDTENIEFEEEEGWW